MLAAVCALVPVTGLLAFFLAGAVVFPFLEPHYAGRVVGSLGLMAVVYGLESIWNLGVIETCGFVSGNCSTHDLSAHAVQLWAWLAGIALAGLVALLRHAKPVDPSSG